ncbi:MAG: Stp1/IreP family PP2C-type Ser/Thr phosphatase [Clostridia bacterium]|nr:Stp1/IreP family PP2C-type Ser/Thr phosphatase [Clostridia bacterium]
MKHTLKMNLSEDTAKHLNDFESHPAQPLPEPTKPIPVLSSVLPLKTSVHRDPCRVTVETRSDVGLVRKVNQDAVISASPLFGVADGMGGHKGGEIASAMCRDDLTAFLEDKAVEGEMLVNAVKVVNRRIHIRSGETPELSGMGTTLTCMWLSRDTAYIAHVGDSRCYLLRDGVLTQLTSDHSMVMEMVRAGMITKEQAQTHPMRNVITRAIGTDRAVEVDLVEEKRRKGDIYLLCSDGLHGQLAEERIREILMEMDLSDAADTLLKETLEKGAPDNVSLVLVCDEDETYAPEAGT